MFNKGCFNTVFDRFHSYNQRLESSDSYPRSHFLLALTASLSTSLTFAPCYSSLCVEDFFLHPNTIPYRAILQSTLRRCTCSICSQYILVASDPFRTIICQSRLYISLALALQWTDFYYAFEFASSPSDPHYTVILRQVSSQARRAMVQ